MLIYAKIYRLLASNLRVDMIEVLILNIQLIYT